MSRRKRHVNEFMRSQQGGRVAGYGIAHDNYDEESDGELTQEQSNSGYGSFHYKLTDKYIESQHGKVKVYKLSKEELARYKELRGI